MAIVIEILFFFSTSSYLLACCSLGTVSFFSKASHHRIPSFTLVVTAVENTIAVFAFLLSGASSYFLDRVRVRVRVRVMGLEF